MPNKEDIEEGIAAALQCLAQHEEAKGRFTTETGETEWNLAHHFANCLAKIFANYDCDIEVTKAPAEYQRPDIIIHKRGSYSDNLLVVELKRNGTKAALADDLEKIQGYWFGLPFKYQFGAVVNVNDRGNKLSLVVVARE